MRSPRQAAVTSRSNRTADCTALSVRWHTNCKQSGQTNPGRERNPMSQSASATSSANGLIRALSAADRDRLQRAFRVVPLARGEVIHEAGEPIDAVHFPL